VSNGEAGQILADEILIGNRHKRRRGRDMTLANSPTGYITPANSLLGKKLLLSQKYMMKSTVYKNG